MKSWLVYDVMQDELFEQSYYIDHVSTIKEVRDHWEYSSNNMYVVIGEI